MFIKNWHDTCLYAIFQRQIDLKQPQHDTGWSRCSWTPSATSTSSTKASTASSSYDHLNLTRHMFIYYFSRTNWFKTVLEWYRVIKMLLDTLSNLVKLNHGEFSKYLLYPSKIEMAHVNILFSKIYQCKMWSWCSCTPSATSTSSTMASTASTDYVHQKFT